MDGFFLMLLAIAGGYVINAQQQRQRIALLSAQLHPFQIEKNMETLTQGYLRAMGEDDATRREQVLSNLEGTEQALISQFKRFSTAFQDVTATQARVSRLPIGLPFATQLLPSQCFDMRAAIAVHADGLERVARNDAQRSPRDKAFTMTAEILLMQHTCHWYCKSKAIASARMLARNKTPLAQLIASVSPETRQAYTALTGASS